MASHKGQKLADGKGVGGKGRLTKKRIDGFQVYYGRAIKENKENVAEAQRAVQAILKHSMSTDRKPSHQYCPKGETSWCGWQRDKARGTQDCHHRNPLPKAVANVLQPLFDRLSEPELLESGIDGFTQNANESLHHILWDFCPKTVYSGSTIVAIAAGLAVLQFNKGSISISQVLKEMGMNPGPHCIAALHRLDRDHIIHAYIKSKKKTKLERKRRRAEKKGLLDAQEETEGVQYAAGQFIADTTIMDIARVPRKAQTRTCKKCKGPMKGHKRGQACPSTLAE